MYTHAQKQATQCLSDSEPNTFPTGTISSGCDFYAISYSSYQRVLVTFHPAAEYLTETAEGKSNVFGLRVSAAESEAGEEQC